MTWPAWARTYLRVFRIVVVSTCVAVAVFAWLASIPWLLGASVCIGIGELLESSYYLVVLDWGQRQERGRKPWNEPRNRLPRSWRKLS